MSTTGCLTASLAVLLGGCPSRAARQKSWSMSCSASQAATILSLSSIAQWHEELLKRGWRAWSRRATPSSSPSRCPARQDGSADGGLQRHRAYVDEPLVGLLYVCFAPDSGRTADIPPGPVFAKSGST